MTAPAPKELARGLRWLDLRSVLVPAGSVLLAVLALDLAFYLFFTRPRLQMAAGTRASLVSLEERLASERAAVQMVRDRLSLIRCVSYDVERFRKEVLSSKVERMTRVQKELRDLARTFQMDPESISYQVQEVNDTDFTSFGINFPLTGSYQDLRQFLHHVEDSELFLLVDAVSLSGGVEGGSALNLNIRMSTYFAGPEPDEPSKAGAAHRASAAGKTGGGHPS